MSGGHFDHSQYRISSIMEEIIGLIISNDDCSLNEWGDRKGRHYSPETIQEFKVAVEILAKAYIYAQRIDWLVSGDDGESAFHSRLKQALLNEEKIARYSS